MRYLALILTLLTGVAHAETPAEVAQRAAGQLQAAHAALTAAESRSDRVAALTETVRAYEVGLAALRAGIRNSADQQRALETGLQAQSEDVARLLGVLQTMARAPTPVLMLHPSGPTGTARAGMMLSDVTPALQTKVDDLREQLDRLAELRRVQDDALIVLQEGLEGAQTARTRLSAAISDRTDLPTRFAEDPVQIAVLLASADTLSAFARGLGDSVETQTPETLRGALPLPVIGTVTRGFNEPDAAGIARPGIVIETAPGALVSTPVSATLRYVGTLLDYGTVIILEPAAETLWILAGVETAFGRPGQILPAGAPLGIMGGGTGDVQEILTESAQGSAQHRMQTLYLEVRERQDSVNPASWFESVD